jgi:FKBP-type peptidyl-prolyl cis-trans isomerase
MFARLVIALAVVSSASLLAQDLEIKTAKQKVSYGFGLNVGRSMLRDGLRRDDLDFQLLVQGLRDALEEKDIRITEKDFNEAFQSTIAPKLTERAKAAAEKWETDNKAFLEANKAKKGVKTTASGLQYRVLKQGTGKSPKATDHVRTTYVGKLFDGTKFDGTEQPIEFELSKVIKGWTEGLQLMKEGDKFEFVVPPALAYGDTGFPPDSPQPTIPGGSALVFEVELVEVLASAPKTK